MRRTTATRAPAAATPTARSNASASMASRETVLLPKREETDIFPKTRGKWYFPQILGKWYFPKNASRPSIKHAYF